MVRFLLLAILLTWGFCGLGWELIVAFTNDLHTALENLAALEPYLSGADLVLDAGDAWEDMYRMAGPAEALDTARWMREVGYDAMVLGNHDSYLGPFLPQALGAAGFPVLGTNIRGIPGLAPWILVRRKGLRILILGFLGPKRGVYFAYPLWPKAELLDPAAAAREALGKAPERDLLIVLAHMELPDAISLARALPECDLLVLGHDHLFLEEPVWAGKVPIVEAGHRAQAVGIAVLGPDGLVDYRLARTGGRARTDISSLLPVVALGLLFLLLARQ